VALALPETWLFPTVRTFVEITKKACARLDDPVRS
jgi:hypothetical protein